jgi:hypothetical protein
MACPIEIIDMGGVDTKNRMHVHWGPPEQYAERREESALRRSGRPVADKAFAAWLPIDLGPLERILAANDYDPHRLLAILDQAQAAYGHLPLPRCSTSATRPVRGTARSTASPLPTRISCWPGRAAEIGLCRCAAAASRAAGYVTPGRRWASTWGVTADGAVRFAAASVAATTAATAGDRQ